MTMYYSPTGGFMESTIHEVIPKDAVPITPEDHTRFFEGFDRGKILKVIDGVPTLCDPPPPPPPTVEQLLEHAGEKRWEFEGIGITVNGDEIATDRDSQGLILGAHFHCTKGRSEPVLWKTKTGWFKPLDAAEVEAIAVAVCAHVELAFTTEADIVGKIRSGEIKTKAAIDTAFAKAAPAEEGPEFEVTVTESNP